MQQTIQNTHYAIRPTQDAPTPPTLDQLFREKFRIEEDIERLVKEREMELTAITTVYYRREKDLRTALFKTIAIIDAAECELNKPFEHVVII